jgi:hypothetical protein
MGQSSRDRGGASDNRRFRFSAIFYSVPALASAASGLVTHSLDGGKVPTNVQVGTTVVVPIFAIVILACAQTAQSWIIEWGKVRRTEAPYRAQLMVAGNIRKGVNAETRWLFRKKLNDFQLDTSSDLVRVMRETQGQLAVSAAAAAGLPDRVPFSEPDDRDP